MLVADVLKYTCTTDKVFQRAHMRSLSTFEAHNLAFVPFHPLIR